ncbi:CvpA family protein [Blattabacterium cuenoti]|uniref:CvpA family protein n=1 Tax=Blattabacterium cuenoti TaxID=1653831 RepID=UPI00163BA0A1|nr:CvpA family protein [Blattabacterium cuenoti]
MVYLADIIILIAVLYGGYDGYHKGLIAQFYVFMVFFLFFYQGSFFFQFFRNLLIKFDHNDTSQNSYLLIVFPIIMSFFSIIFCTLFLKRIIDGFLSFTCMKPIDQMLGGILGMIKYFIYILICLFLIKETNKQFNFFPDIFLKNSFDKIFKMIIDHKESFYHQFKTWDFQFPIFFDTEKEKFFIS